MSIHSDLHIDGIETPHTNKTMIKSLIEERELRIRYLERELEKETFNLRVLRGSL